MQILLIQMSVQLEPTTVMQMLNALILQLASTVPAEMGSLEMDGIALVHCIEYTGDAVTYLKT